MNWEVVKRRIPCRWYVDPERMSLCRSCGLLTHIRVQHESRTLCGHPCLPEDRWDVMFGEHPEDVAAVDRCLVCYGRAEGVG